MKIAIAGAAASGKGTLARMLALELKLPHYDFGLLFRAIVFTDFETNFIRVENGKILFKGQDITESLKTEEVGLLAAKSAHILKHLAQSLVRHVSFICDGRTCGTEIYPDAEHKFFLHADFDERQRRRGQQGGNLDFFKEREVIDEVKLRMADGAVVINTTGKTKAECLDLMLRKIQK